MAGDEYAPSAMSNSGVSPISKVPQQFGATEGTLASHRGEITGYHFFNEVVEQGSMTPPEFLVRLARIAEQVIDFRRPEMAWIDLDQHFAGRSVNPLLVHTCSTPDDRAPDFCESPFDKEPHRVRLAGSRPSSSGSFC